MLSLGQQRDKLDEALEKNREALLLRRDDLEEQMRSMQTALEERMLHFAVRRTFLEELLRGIMVECTDESRDNSALGEGGAVEGAVEGLDGGAGAGAGRMAFQSESCLVSGSG